MTGPADPGPDRSFDPDRHIALMGPALGLAITDAQRPGVARFLETAHVMARCVFAVPLDPDGLDLAPVYRPGVTSGTIP